MDLETARKQPILDVALACGLTFKKKGGIYQDEKMHVTIYPRTNSYYNFYEQRGGSPIDLLTRELNMSFKEAVVYLLNFAGTPVEQKEYDKKETGAFTLPEKAESHATVFHYLTAVRNLDPRIVEALIKDGLIYEEKKYHNCVFVGVDQKGVPRHAFLHGCNEGHPFKGDARYSDKRYGFTFLGKDNETLTVFEAPIDLLSYVTLMGEVPTHMTALGMLSTDPIDLFLREHKEVKKIRFLLDRDVWGKQAAEKYKEVYLEKGYDTEDDGLSKELDRLGVKDVNEYLTETEKKRSGPKR